MVITVFCVIFFIVLFLLLLVMCFFEEEVRRTDVYERRVGGEVYSRVLE